LEVLGEIFGCIVQHLFQVIGEGLLPVWFLKEQRVSGYVLSSKIVNGKGNQTWRLFIHNLIQNSPAVKKKVWPQKDYCEKKM